MPSTDLIPLPSCSSDGGDREADLQRIEEALATLERVSDAWYQHDQHLRCPPGLLLSLHRLRSIAGFGQVYARALRVVREG